MGRAGSRWYCEDGGAESSGREGEREGGIEAGREGRREGGREGGRKEKEKPDDTYMYTNVHILAPYTTGNAIEMMTENIPPSNSPTTLKHSTPTHTLTHASVALIMLLPVNNERIFHFANGWDVSYTLLEKFLVCVYKLSLHSWIKNIAGMTHTRSGNVMILWEYRMLFHGGCTCRHGKCGTAVTVCGEDSGAASCCVGL